jgi:hypothetical protein
VPQISQWGFSLANGRLWLVYPAARSV